jgi:ketosteroid isomerase-like protein/quercetin dioxygenase-like cupin family protein
MARPHILGIATLAALGGCAKEEAPAPPPPANAVWDDAAAAEIRAASTQMIEAFNKGDVAAVKALLAHDSMTTSLDYDLENKPVVLTATGVDAYLDKTGAQIAEMMKAGGKFEQKVASIDCKATATLGWCFMTIQGNGTMPGGQPVSQIGWGTAVYRKGADGWKATHWHATMAPPPAAALAAAVTGAKEMKWTEIPGIGVKQVTLWENAEARSYGYLDEFPKKFSSPAHMHSANFWIYVLKGQFTHTPKGGTPRVVEAGGLEVSPGHEVHTTAAGSAGATILVVGDKPFDILDEQGKPMQPPPAAGVKTPAGKPPTKK